MKKIILLLAASIITLGVFSQDKMNKKMENTTDKMNKKMDNSTDKMNKKLNNDTSKLNKNIDTAKKAVRKPRKIVTK